MGICRSLYHSFNFVYMIFIVEVYFSLSNSIGRLTFIVLCIVLPKCLCLDYAQYKTLPMECRQNINYAIN